MNSSPELVDSLVIGAMLAILPLFLIYSQINRSPNLGRKSHLSIVVTALLYAVGFSVIARESSNSAFLFFKRLEFMPVDTIAFGLGALLPALLVHYFVFMRGDNKDTSSSSVVSYESVAHESAAPMGTDDPAPMALDLKPNKENMPTVQESRMAGLRYDIGAPLSGPKTLEEMGITTDHAGRFWLGSRVFSDRVEAIAAAIGVVPVVLVSDFVDQYKVVAGDGGYWYRGLKYDYRSDAEAAKRKIKEDSEREFIELVNQNKMVEKRDEDYVYKNIVYESLADIERSLGLVFVEDPETGRIDLIGRREGLDVLVDSDSTDVGGRTVSPDVDEIGYRNQISHATSLSAEKLRELKSLLDDGVLTQSEFDQKKSEILKRY